MYIIAGIDGEKNVFFFFAHDRMRSHRHQRVIGINLLTLNCVFKAIKTMKSKNLFKYL